MIFPDRIDIRDVKHLVSILEELIKMGTMSPLTERLGIKIPSQ